jgi:hypothetical protein
MAAPVLVRSYTGTVGQSSSALSAPSTPVQALPPISSYAFANILRSADNADFQLAIDGIAEICAKSRMSLAEEYASHMPPVGEITAVSSVAGSARHTSRPGMRRALTSVPEASSSSSEGSGKSKRRRTIFGFGRLKQDDDTVTRQIRISSMGRTISIGSTTAMARVEWPVDSSNQFDTVPLGRPSQPQRSVSDATASLQRLLGQRMMPG